MFIQILLLILGLVLLITGANWLVDGASALAKKYKVSDLTIGLTIVAFGTSAPELAVNSFASLQHYQDIVFGNVIGSNNFNLFFILGLAGIITPLSVQSNTVWKEIPLSFVAIGLLFLMANDFLSPGVCLLTRFDGLLLLMLFGLFLYYVYRQLKTDKMRAETSVKRFSGIKVWAMILIGLVLLVAGGRLVVVKAVQMAAIMGISEKIIGLTIVAAGTSLPELATSVVAAIKRNNDIAVGNIIGSNIFNIFLILSVSSLINPIVYDPKFNTGLYLLAGGTAFLFIAMFTGQKKKLDRWEAGILLISFFLYNTFILSAGL
ncbi:MAG: calcium/sodium antiporter [Bacteroidales bacterium]|nr:calcium/sodium antiporter [Bacteroidales bacterium]